MINEVYLIRRMRHLPDAIDATERKLAALYAEAAEYRMKDILEKPSAANAAWDREVLLAQVEAAARGEEYSIGIDNVD